MDELPLVFVGTMYSGEGDYTKCCDAILNQKGVSIQHIIIAHEPEKLAHNRLWNAWRRVQHNGPVMFVKIDADTVLFHDEVLLEFYKMLQANPRITGIQAPLLDYFTDGYINGLNCFTPKVVFQDTGDELFCDRQVDVNHDIVIKSKQVPETLRPAGSHCYDASDIQAFHFGLHRALKNQTEILQLVKKAWLANDKDVRRGFALLGASCTGLFSDGKFNYTDDGFKEVFEATANNYDKLILTL